MRMAAVRDCQTVFAHFGISLTAGSALEVGGTELVHLDDRADARVARNPLLDVHPRLTLLDRGFNREDIGAASDEELDFLDPAVADRLRDRFDLVFSFDTLEHVEDPFRFCEHLLAVTRPGGHVYVSTVFSWVYHPSPEDYFRFSPAGLRACFARLPSTADGPPTILWSGWESDERGVALLAARPPSAIAPDADFSLRPGVSRPPGMLPGRPLRQRVERRLRHRLRALRGRR